MDHDLDQEQMETTPNYYARVMKAAEADKYNGTLVEALRKRIENQALMTETLNLRSQDLYAGYQEGLKGTEDYTPFIWGEMNAPFHSIFSATVSRHVAFRLITELLHIMVEIMKAMGELPEITEDES